MNNFDLPSNAGEELEKDPIIEGICNILREAWQASQDKPYLINLPRYREMLLAKTALDKLLQKNGEEASQVRIQPFFDYGALVAEAQALEVQDGALFRRAIAGARNFEIYPLTNGKICIAILYDRMFYPLEEFGGAR